MAITTRQNPNKNKFDIQITKRKRGPNKKAIQMELETSPNKTSPDISTQNDPDSNEGKGLSAIRDDKHADLFTARSSPHSRIQTELYESL